MSVKHLENTDIIELTIQMGANSKLRVMAEEFGLIPDITTVPYS